MIDPHDVLEPMAERQGIGISWIGVLMGLIIGVALGLFYAWQIDPVVVRNIAPAELRSSDKQMYIVAIAQEYAADGDLQRAVTRILEIEPDVNPFQVAANTVCDLIQSGQVDNLTSIEVVRNLRSIYEPQGIQASCDTAAFNTPIPVTLVLSTPTTTPTPTITPVASKTPTRPFEPLPANTPMPTNTLPSGDGTGFRPVRIEPFCDEAISGVIEVYVRDENTGAGLAGIAVEVNWNNAQSRQVFYTGLKPERGNDYADFVMEAGNAYRVTIQGAVSESTNPLDATPCDSAGSITSYRIVIQRYSDD